MMEAMTTSTTSTTERYQRGLRDLPREHGFEPLALHGSLPHDLHGTLYLNGPGLFGLFGRPYRHWFDGDGAITAVRFGSGRAHGAVRLVAGAQLREERLAGRALYTSGSTLAPQWRRRLGLRFKNAANTKPLLWNERLFALYEGGLPTEIDRETLATVGETDLNGVAGGFSAHFHAVPSRCALYNFSIERGRQNMLHLYELPAGAALRCIGSLPLPKSSAMVHDFIATEKHLVFFIPPVRMRILPVLLGMKAPLDALDWRPEDGTTVLVVPIDAPRQARRFEVEAFFQYHFMNAYESGDAVVVDFVRVLDFDKAFASHTPEQRAHKTETEGRLFRAIVQPRRGTVELAQLAETPCEFPQVGPAVQSREHRFGYVLTAREGEPQTSIAKIELATGRIESTSVGDHCFPSDPVFVPRAGAEEEDDGYLLTLAYDAAADRSLVAVLDARQPDRGVLARVGFDHHIPRPLHGTWHGASGAT